MGSSVMLNGVEYVGEQIAYKDSTYELVSKVAFLIGVPQRIFENEHEAPQLDVYERLSKDIQNYLLHHKDVFNYPYQKCADSILYPED